MFVVDVNKVLFGADENNLEEMMPQYDYCVEYIADDNFEYYVLVNFEHYVLVGLYILFAVIEIQV